MQFVVVFFSYNGCLEPWKKKQQVSEQSTTWIYFSQDKLGYSVAIDL